jgi:phage terminase large subunit-like protein
VAQIFSASDPESLRGPQFDAAWCDELGKWPKGSGAWDNLQLALRLGSRPRAVVTTTPRSTPLLLGLVEAKGTVLTRAPTAANRMNLAPEFLAMMAAKYAGSRTERQELEGEFLLDTENALWSWELIEAARKRKAEAPDRIVIAVDPPVTSGEQADACGIIVAGVVQRGSPHEWTAEVIADGTVRGVLPQAWAARVVELFHAHAADRVVAETNQGGDLVRAMLHQFDPALPFRAVRATRSKGVRAEPAAVLYEQGRVSHRAEFRELEEEMRLMTVAGFRGRNSPDRVDALVWALTELIVEPAASYRNPRLRSL